MPQTGLDIITEKLDANIQTFQNAATQMLRQEHFVEFEKNLQKLPNIETAKIRYSRRAGEALFMKMAYEKAQQYFQQGLSLAQAQKEYSEQALAWGSLAEIARVQGKYRLALSQINEALDILTKTENDLVLARLSILAGLISIALGMYENASARFYTAYSLYTKLEDKDGIALALIRMGTADMMQERYSQAEKWLTKSLDLCDELGDKHLKAGALTNLGEICRLEGKYSEAQKNYYLANTLFRELGLWRGVAITSNNRAHVSVTLREYELAKHLYGEVFETAKRHGLVPEMMDTLAGISLLLDATGKEEAARKVIKILINSPILLDESKLLLTPLTEKFNLSVGKPENISTSQLETLFQESLQTLDQ